MASCSLWRLSLDLLHTPPALLGRFRNESCAAAGTGGCTAAVARHRRARRVVGPRHQIARTQKRPI
eukprot:330799-Lingulodinium_polyedra.AAC.1